MILENNIENLIRQYEYTYTHKINLVLQSFHHLNLNFEKYY